MSGVLVGLLFGVGVLLIIQAFIVEPRTGVAAKTNRQEVMQDRLIQAGMPAVTPLQFYAVTAAGALLTLLVMFGISKSFTIAIAFAVFAGIAPRSFINWRRLRNLKDVRDLWPDVVDNLSSGVRAGLSLPEALASLAVRGPERLRPAFNRFAEDYRATGHLGPSLDRLKAELADPVADRVIEAVRMAREVGGNDLGRLLRTLSTFLREDSQTRGELETRQGWTINAARLSLASPWVILAIIASQPSSAHAYNTKLGAVVLAIGGGVSFVAYRVMMRIARLPEDERVLR
jgi:tight adherence protein B